ncbi:MAG: sensor N-terminal transmembrane domain-containing protein, partial [Thermoanaerobaculia bacterium]|nr:sensor N-terminal transmembrane domain-containing protein [Thermoanaerobaculia bacterium]
MSEADGSRTLSRMPKWRRYLSRIAIRLMAFNLLVVILPIAGILYLDIYEDHLVAAQERSMFGRAEVLASVIGASGGLTPVVIRITEEIGSELDTRARIVNEEGRLLADSGPPSPATASESQARQSFLY